MKSKILNDLIPAIAAIVIITLLSVGYIFTLGQRVTQSRNLYLEVYEKRKSGNFNADELVKKLDEANNLWHDRDIDTLKAQITSN